MTAIITTRERKQLQHDRTSEWSRGTLRVARPDHVTEGLAAMSATTAASIVLGALKDAFPVNPWLAALWFLSALALAALLVYGWRRLVQR
jgi:hypothetical protein